MDKREQHISYTLEEESNSSLHTIFQKYSSQLCKATSVISDFKDEKIEDEWTRGTYSHS